MFERIKGTQDFLDLTLFNFVITTIKKHLASYHFTEIATPLIEPTDLFIRSLGQETDVVSKEMFLIASKHQEREGEMCLRPEATAAIVRAFVENGIETLPWKVFEWGPMFRYERPQKGRYRQFHQVSVEVIGSASIMQDVQLLKMFDRLFHEQFKINDYALLINFLGCASDRQRFEQTLKNFLEKTPGMCQLCQQRKEKNILRIFDCKNPECQKLYQNAPHTTDTLCQTCQQEWTGLQQTLELLSVSAVHQPTLVRGLDYYTKTVFEFASNHLGSQNAFCAGGRYDSLVASVGGKEDQPSLGAAIGIERLLMILQAHPQAINLPTPPALHVIMPLSAEQQGLALLVADELQAHNLATEVLLDGASVKSMMRKANKAGAKFCLLLGSDEQATGHVTLKNMITGAEQRLPQSDAIKLLAG